MAARLARGCATGTRPRPRLAPASAGRYAFRYQQPIASTRAPTPSSDDAQHQQPPEPITRGFAGRGHAAAPTQTQPAIANGQRSTPGRFDACRATAASRTQRPAPGGCRIYAAPDAQWPTPGRFDLPAATATTGRKIRASASGDIHRRCRGAALRSARAASATRSRSSRPSSRSGCTALRSGGGSAR